MPLQPVELCSCPVVSMAAISRAPPAIGAEAEGVDVVGVHEGGVQAADLLASLPLGGSASAQPVMMSRTFSPARSRRWWNALLTERSRG